MDSLNLPGSPLDCPESPHEHPARSPEYPESAHHHYAQSPDIELNVEVELNVDIDEPDALELSIVREDDPKTAPLFGDQDLFVQSLLQKELKRRRELAEQPQSERISQTCTRPSSRASAAVYSRPPSVVHVDHVPSVAHVLTTSSYGHVDHVPSVDILTSRLSLARGSCASVYSRPSTSSDVHHGGESDALAMNNLEVADHGRESLVMNNMEVANNGRMSLVSRSSVENAAHGPPGVEARVDALRRRSSFKSPEKPDPIGFVREKGVNDQLNQVDLQLRKVMEKKKVNEEHMYIAMLNAGQLKIDPGIKLPTRPPSPDGHAKHKSRQRPVKKDNVEAANKWIHETKPDHWLVFSERAGWIQNREIKKELKHLRTKMLKQLNRKGCSFAQWLSDHGRDYGVCDTDFSARKDESDLEEFNKKKSAPTQDEPAPKTPASRTSMALNEGAGMMYKGVSSVRGADRTANTNRFWRPTVSNPVGLQAPMNFHKPA